MHLTLERIGASKPWVARITGRDAEHGLRRTFLDGMWSRTWAQRKGNRGVGVAFELGPGLYEVSAPKSWQHTVRYFLLVEPDGSDRELEDADEIAVAVRAAEVAGDRAPTIDAAREALNRLTPEERGRLIQEYEQEATA